MGKKTLQFEVDEDHSGFEKLDVNQTKKFIFNKDIDDLDIELNEKDITDNQKELNEKRLSSRK